MKVDGNALRPGNMIEHNNRLWLVIKAEHVKPGKGPAYAQVELKDVESGTKLNERFRSSESLSLIRLDEEQFQYLFREGDQFTFMNAGTFEQISVDAKLVGDEQIPFLKDGMMVAVSSHEGRPLSITLPEQVVLTITEADAVVKGQTASSSYKPALLENGVRIMVPPHVTAGTRVVVDTRTKEYVERAKD